MLGRRLGSYQIPWIGGERKVKNRAGVPGGIRTPDSQVRSLVLYPAELRARVYACVGLFYHHRRQVSTDQLVTDAVDGDDDVLLGETLTDFATQVLDMAVDGAVVTVETITLHPVEELVAGKDPARRAE
jgi:hypothetical protein